MKRKRKTWKEFTSFRHETPKHFYVPSVLVKPVILMHKLTNGFFINYLFKIFGRDKV